MILATISFLFIIMVLVTTHELGHFFCAKLLGVKVETFSIGFGPKAVSFSYGGTKYALGIIPLGGYVSLGETPPKDFFDPKSKELSERPPLHKMAVAAAGPVANFLLAAIVLTIVCGIGVKEFSYLSITPIVGWVDPSSNIAKTDMQAGDIIQAINNKPVSTWEGVLETLPYDKVNLEITFSSQGQIKKAVLPTTNRNNFGIYPKETLRIGLVKPKSPAALAGLKPGDVVVAIDNKPMNSWIQLVKTVEDGNNNIRLTVQRNHREFILVANPQIDPKIGKRQLGIGHDPDQIIRRYSLKNALAKSFNQTVYITTNTIKAVRDLLIGRVSIKMLGGPILIAQSSGNVARNGFLSLLTFLAFVSIQLGIFNLMPFIPVVDGGLIMLYSFEALFRRPFKESLVNWYARIGWCALGGLILIITYNDIGRLF
jgi:regulator of sigma E protease